MDLSQYVRIGRYDLPEPKRTAAPVNSVLAQEVSAVTYNKDTDTLFVLGDGGTSIVQVTKTGQLINSMTLATGSSPQGTEFYDPEGLTYIGNGMFVMTEERDQNAVLFTYQAGTTLTRANAVTINLGPNVGNIGLEGLTFDPFSGGYIFVKEKDPENIFQTTIDFSTGAVSNKATTSNQATALFNAASLNLLDFADVFSLSSSSFFAGKVDQDHILVLSQESGRIVEVDRMGNVLSSLTIVSDPGNPLSVVDQQHEGLTVDAQGFLYVVSENGGGDIDHPQLWVYAPVSAVNQAPTGLSLVNAVSAIDENTSTVARIKVADVVVADDGIGTNTFSLTGADAASFQVDSTGLYIKAGSILDFEAKNSYSVTVNVDDASVGATPDASASYTLKINDIAIESGPPKVYISEVAPFSSGNSPVGSDWFEVTNGGNSALDITGWRMDDNSFAFATSVALNGVTSLAAGESVIFLEVSGSQTAAGVVSAFVANWFGGTKPAGLQIGTYGGSGVGLSTGGDGVALFDAAGVQQAKVSFGTSPNGPFPTFDNAAGVNNATIVDSSKIGLHGTFIAPGNANGNAAELGSPGSVGRLIVSEVAPWGSGNTPYAADWFELTNTSAFAIDITGWKMDDNSQSPAAAVALNGIKTIAPGESVIFLEASSDAAIELFRTTWFGTNALSGLQIGRYNGSGVGLSTTTDQVNIYDAANALRASVTFGTSTTGLSFDNAAGLNGATISKLSAIGVNAAFVAAGDATETGSPGEIVPTNDAPIAIDDALVSIKEGTGDRIIPIATLLANDRAGPFNENGQALNLTAVSNALGGTVKIVGANVVFTPTTDFAGVASFDYTVRDNGTSYGLPDAKSDVGKVTFAVEFVNQAPQFTSPAEVSTLENTLLAATVAATDREHDPIAFSLTGGADKDAFTIDSSSGAITFTTAPDFETPQDASGDGVYDVQVTATDALGNATTQMLHITVTDLAEAGFTRDGGNGANTLDGGFGNDVLRGNNGRDLVRGGDGDDMLYGNNGDDALAGGRGADLLDGGNGGDRLDGGIGEDTLLGGKGDDVLIGGEGADRLLGGTGADIFAFGVGDSLPGGFDKVLDFNGREGDRFDFTALGIERWDIAIARTGTSKYLISIDLNHDGVTDFGIEVDSTLPLLTSYFIT